MRLRDLAELVRAPAALSVPGDTVAGAAASGGLRRSTPGLAAASVCLYWGGMAANDWADRELDAHERPERPIPSGRIGAGQALLAAAGLTAAGVGLAALAGGRRAAAVAVPLAGAVWIYDLWAKNTAAGPPMMALCRGLDVLLGASGGDVRRAVPAALTVAAHTYTVTALSRHEVSGATPALPLSTLAGTVGVAAAAAAAKSRFDHARTHHRAHPPKGEPPRPFSQASGRLRASNAVACGQGDDVDNARSRSTRVMPAAGTIATTALAAWYLNGYGRAQLRAAADPTAAPIRAAVGAGITELPSLQGALTAKAGSPAYGIGLALMAPLARRLARKVSPT
ncbi:UbiA family prenyltransferase [Actinoplanes sp. TRM 88003]|uniref:UbiA family prenyltransferase n=1 Tax=Paractinoplanes aksuensis TaxID=2939490 RepID=A0ABT1DVT3_9ACTN|nr:UbiA family prenyltransferase [Actinoplanes aksuensis]MCO8274962.1 UbiA family prenyltransferase [Actinoplanes aksuensis]